MKEKLTNIGIPVALLLLITAIAIAGILRVKADEKDEAVAVTVPVELNVDGNVKGSSYGLMVTIGNENAQGSQWNQAASGAKVALERFNRSGADLHLVTEDDRGTDEGARQAVENLVAQKVSGIVISSSGDHVQAAVQAAKERNIPVILPYENSIDDARSLQPSTESLNDVLSAEHPGGKGIIRIDQEGFAGIDVPAERTLSVNGFTDINTFSQSLVKDTAEAGSDTVVFVDASAYQEAKLTRALQEAGLKTQIVLGPQATSPAFNDVFMKDNQSTVINAQSIGFNAGDSVALQSDGQGRSMSAYLQMVKILSESKDAMSVMGDQKFSDVAASADSRSHDALVALVRATEHAESIAPQDVKASLNDLKLSSADGIASADMDFAQHHVIQDAPLLLSANAGDVEMRVADANAPSYLVWFAQA